MSYITNSVTEKSVRCGFYDSVNSDRTYTASDMSSIFDGIINKGIFATVGDAFAITLPTYESSVAKDDPIRNTVNVGTGKAWFNRKWIVNESILPVELPSPDPIMSRYDAIIIRVDETEAVRDCFITFKEGEPTSYLDELSYPNMEDSEYVHEYPIAYIYRPNGSTTITDSRITHMLGSDSTPIVTGPLEVTSVENFNTSWQAQLTEFVNERNNEIKEFTTSKKNEIDDFIAAEGVELQRLKDTVESEYTAECQRIQQDYGDWTDVHKNSFDDWFANMRNQLSEDAAGNLQLQHDTDEIKQVLTNGFTNGTKTFSNDGSVITSVDSLGRTLVKTFSESWTKITTVLTDKNDIELGRLVKTISADGKTMETTITLGFVEPETL